MLVCQENVVPKTCTNNSTGISILYDLFLSTNVVFPKHFKCVHIICTTSYHTWDKSHRSRNMQVLVLFMLVSCILEDVTNPLNLRYKTLLVPYRNTLPSKIKVLYKFPENKESIRKSLVRSFSILPVLVEDSQEVRTTPYNHHD